MEGYNMNKLSPGFSEKPGNGPCSLIPSLAHVFAVVTALVLIGTPIIYLLSAQRAHAALVAELRAEVRELKERVDQLEARDTTEISTNRNQNQDKYLKMLLMDFTEEKPEEKSMRDSESRVNFLEKLFGSRDLDSESDAEWIADLQDTGPSSLEPEMMRDDKSPWMSQEEDDIFSLADRSDETPLHHHGDKLSTIHAQARGDVRREATNREPARRRPRRQAENRESRNQNRESRNRNRDRKASKGAGKRNRGNGGSTGRREQGDEEAQQQNGGERRQRSRCQCPQDQLQLHVLANQNTQQKEGNDKIRLSGVRPEHQPAYVHFVGNVSSRVHTDPERIHPLSPRMVNITENLLSDWVYAAWTRYRQKAKFVLNEGVVTVLEAGTYYIYSQVQFFDDDRYTGHVITINDEETFKCAESPPQRPRNMHTCHIGGLAHLHGNSRVAVRVAFPHRWVNMHPDSSYFGMYRVAGL